jgi:gliding motility-associated-like protein
LRIAKKANLSKRHLYNFAGCYITNFIYFYRSKTLNPSLFLALNPFLLMFIPTIRIRLYGVLLLALIHSHVSSQTPGGVTSSGLKLWFKADLGVDHTGGQVFQWNDVSASANVTDQPKKTANTHVTFRSGAANFNPTVLFNGTRLEQLKGSSNNLGGTPTLFTVSRSTNTSAFNPVFSNLEWDRSIPNLLYAKKTGPGLYVAGDYYVVDAAEAWINNSADAPAAANQLDIMSFVYETVNTTTNTRLFKNGSLSDYHTGAGKPNTSNIKTIEIGGRSADDDVFPGRIFNGDLVEIIYFNDNLDQANRQKVESYLAIKYGITLQHNYLSSANTIVYDVSSYSNNIIGIGRDDRSALYQKQSRGENYQPVLTIALNQVAADNQSNTATFATDQTIFLTGSNNLPLTATTTGLPPAVDSWLERKWKATLSGGNINNLLISIPDTYLSTLTGNCDLMLIMADDQNFTTNLTTYNLSRIGNTSQAIITLTPGTRYFTFGKTNSLDVDLHYKQDICNPLSVQFFNAGNATQNPYWSFGDGNTITNVLTPVHTYNNFGNYTIRFGVQNGTCVDTIEKVISIFVSDNDVIFTPDTTICDGSGKQLRTRSSLNFCWSPANYLDNANLPNPVTSTTQNITYYFTAEVAGNNLITNGDFSGVNNGFTSQYNYINQNNAEGQYFVGNNPQLWNSSLGNCTDHTTGSGNMMFVDGSAAADVVVWTTTITIVPNTNYAFSTWIQALSPANPARLQFSINGKTIGNLITALLPTCTWKQYYTTWNSGNNTTAIISIVNKNIQLQGNDFALDDISFAPVFIFRDSVIIDVEKPIVRTNNDTIVCINSPVQLYATGSSHYEWFPATDLSATTIADPVATPADSIQYIVTGTTTNGCMAKDTVVINTYPKPLLSISNDTAICPGVSIPLFAGGGLLYQWLPANTLDNPNIATPVSSPTADTRYTVQITDANECNYLDSVDVDIIEPPEFTVSENQAACKGDTVSLTAGGGDVYSWSPATYLSDPSIATPTAFPENTTQYTVQITESTCNYDTTLNVMVNIRPNPEVSAQKTNDIDCITPSTQLNASGAQNYLWYPAYALDNPNSVSPLAAIDTTTTFTVKGTNEFGCFAFDTITVKVTQAGKPLFVLPNAFTPNGDAKNECFGIRKWGSVQQLEFSVFNRWGERIFTSNNPSHCWDGTYRGKHQQNGVYAYVIKAKSFCGEIVRTGTVMLLR